MVGIGIFINSSAEMKNMIRPAISRRVESRSNGQLTTASSRFGRYDPMDKHEARGLKVEGTELERLRARREMLRSMTPEKASEVIEFHKGLNLFQALALAKREGKIIVPHFVHDRILTETKDPEERSSPDCSDRTMGILSPRATSLLGDRERSSRDLSKGQTDRDRRSRDEEYLKQNYPVWTGTLVIYEAPDKSFGEQVVFSWKAISIDYSISFTIPEQFRGKINCALVVEHPDFELVDLGNNRYELKVVDERSVHQIQSFAKEDGWHNYDEKSRVPIGAKVKHDVDHGIDHTIRHLWRSRNFYIGPVKRAIFSYGRHFQAEGQLFFDSLVALF